MYLIQVFGKIRAGRTLDNSFRVDRSFNRSDTILHNVRKLWIVATEIIVPIGLDCRCKFMKKYDQTFNASFSGK